MFLKNKRIVVIGGLSAGPSAAARARRLDPKAEILLFEKGPDISYATCGIPYALSNEIKGIPKLKIVSPELLRRRFKIDVHLNEEVLQILPEPHEIKTSQGVYGYDKLIVATGASPIVPAFSGFKEAGNWSTVRSLDDTDRLLKGLSDSQNVLVLGGGLIGLEVAENLQKAGKIVTVVEGFTQVLSPWSQSFAAYAKQVLEAKGIRVVLGRKVSELRVNEGNIVGAVLDSGELLSADYLVVAVGVRPNTRLLTEHGVKTLPNGAVIVNAKMETGLADIYAAGDCVAVEDSLTRQAAYYPLGTHSNKCGRIAGANAVGASESFKGAIGTAIVKLFDYTFARTGVNSDLPSKVGELETASLITSSTASYYPNPEPLWVKIVFVKSTGKLVGAEVAGKVGADKRIDVFATAIYAGLTVDDLSQLDLAYAPPYAPAKDPVVVAGFVAQNQREKRFLAAEPIEAAAELGDEDVLFIDVREASEQSSQGTVPNALCLSLDKLDISVLPEKGQFFIYCQKGLRGYLACLKLKAQGVNNVTNVAGGFEAWRQAGLPIV